MAKRDKKHSTWPLLVIGVLLLLAAGAGAAWRIGLPLPGFPSQKSPEKPGQTAAAAARGLIRVQGEVTVPPNSPYRARIVVAPVEARQIRKVRAFPAVVEADPAHTVNILPPLGGRVTELKVQLGEAVSAGQILVAIESGDLAQAQADIEKAKAAVELTRKALDRARDLAKIGGGAVKDLESALNDNAQAVAEQRRAEIRLATIAGKGRIVGERRLLISAPVSGTVTALATSAGSYINDPTQALMTISNLDAVYVTANVPETDIGFVHADEAVEFSLVAYPGRTFHGRVTSISGILEPDTRRNKVRILFDNKEGLLKPNMFAIVRVRPQPVQTLVLPASALLMVNDTTSVFIETKPWTFARRTIKPGADLADRVEVEGGLSAGDRVVVRGGVLLND